MKKLTTFILIALFCISISACSLVPDAEVVTVPVEAGEEAEPAAAQPSVGADDKAAEALLEIMEELYTDYHPGTAGSSLRLVSISGKLLDWYALNGSIGAVSKATAAFAANHNDYNIVDESTEISVGFPNALRSVWRCAAEMCFSGGDAILDDAGYSKQANWDPAQAEVLFSQLYAALALEPPLRVNVYYGNRDKAALPVESVNEYELISALRCTKILTPEIQMNAFIRDGDHLAIDFDKEYTAYLNCLDAAGEHNNLSCVVLTFLDAYSAGDITFTTDGKPLSTNYGTYDFAIKRSDI